MKSLLGLILGIIYTPRRYAPARSYLRLCRVSPKMKD